MAERRADEGGEKFDMRSIRNDTPRKGFVRSNSTMKEK